MALITMTVCDECGKQVERLIDINNSQYCSRDCYLDMCKRKFNSYWMQAIKQSHSEAIVPEKPHFTRVA